TLLSRAPGSESQPATRVPPGFTPAGACWPGFAVAAGTVVGWAAGFGCAAVGWAAGLVSAGVEAVGVLGAGAIGAHAWMSPTVATSPRVCRKPRREIKQEPRTASRPEQAVACGWYCVNDPYQAGCTRKWSVGLPGWQVGRVG